MDALRECARWIALRQGAKPLACGIAGGFWQRARLADGDSVCDTGADRNACGLRDSFTVGDAGGLRDISACGLGYAVAHRRTDAFARQESGS